MKKAILTLGLFSLVVLTSFTTTENQTQNMVVETGDTGDTGNNGGQGQDLRSSNKKLDGVTDTGVQGQDLRGSNKKLDFASTSTLNIELNKKKLDI